jgi:hypothetical protein
MPSDRGSSLLVKRVMSAGVIGQGTRLSRTHTREAISTSGFYGAILFIGCYCLSTTRMLQAYHNVLSSDFSFRVGTWI